MSMQNKHFLAIILKLFILALLLTVYFIVSMMLSGVGEQPSPSSTASSAQSSDSVRVLTPNNVQQAEEAGKTLLILFVFCFILSIVWTVIVLRAEWSGWKLIAAVFWAYYGIGTVLPQIESLVYLPRQLPTGMIPKLFLSGFMVAILFAPTVVLLLGKMKSVTITSVQQARISFSLSEGVWKSAVIMMVYIFLYYAFGYYLAWKNPVLRDYYGGNDPGNFLAQMASIWESTPWMFLLQAARSLLWIVFTLPVILMLKGKSWHVSLVIACLFAVWSLMLLLPNPFMPREVALTHLVETITSNFIFGWLVGWLFYPRFTEGHA